MNFDVQTIKCPIKRITKRLFKSEYDTYAIYLGVKTINPKDMKVKTSAIKRFYPIMAAGNHELPTVDGFKKASDLKKDDVILLTLNLVCKK